MSTRRTVIKSEWKAFIEGSSVRGLKRTTTSPSVCLRCFWVTFLVVSIGVMSYQIYLVVHNYISLYDATTIQSQTIFDKSEPFPAVSICSPSLNGKRLTELNLQPRDINAKIRAMVSKVGPQAAELVQYLDSFEGFAAQVPFALIPNVTVNLVSSAILIKYEFRNGTKKSLIVNTNLFSNFGAKKNESMSLPSSSTNPPIPSKYNVSNELIITPFYHPDYMLCYTIKLNLSFNDLTKISRMFLVLTHTPYRYKTVPNSEHPLFEANVDKTYRAFPLNSIFTGSSSLLALHEYNEYPKPFIDSNGARIRSGSVNEIYFKTHTNYYDKCNSQKSHQHGLLGSFKHTIGHCKNTIRNQFLKEQCNCTEDHFAWTMLENCLTVKNWSDPLGFHNFYRKCQHDLHSEAFITAMKSCNLPPCKQTRYVYKNTNSEWAINDFQWKWIWRLLGDLNTNLDMYLNFADNDTVINDEDFDYEKIKNIMSSAHITREDSAIYVNTEVPLTSAGNLFSSIGGALSLYVGITVTLCAEFLEFLYKTGTSLSSRKTPNNVITVQVSPTKEHEEIMKMA